MKASGIAPRVLASAAGAGLVLLCLFPAACLVEPGECVFHGVEVDPCLGPIKVGQTITLDATVTSDPAQAVTWLISTAVDTGFDTTVDGNSIHLVGALGLAGVYTVRAESATDPDVFGDATITVSTHSYGFPPSPVQVNGADFPDDKSGAVAVGGDRSYVAYADHPDGPAPAAGPSSANFFVQQFSLSTGALLGSVANQFLTFDPADPNTSAPNVAADCLGNGYWLDKANVNAPPTMFRLSPAGVSTSVTLTGLTQAGPMAVACDGTIYFFGENAGSGRDIYKAASFGAPFAVFPIPDDPTAGQVFDSIAVDPQGRIVMGDSQANFTVPIIRVLPDGDVDDAFAPLVSPVGVVAVAADGQGVVYGASEGGVPAFGLPPPVIAAFNSFGAIVYTIDEYQYNCPAGCATPDCGTMIPFARIQSLACSPAGQLRAIDDVTMNPTNDPNFPPACQVTVRLVLIDP